MIAYSERVADSLVCREAEKQVSLVNHVEHRPRRVDIVKSMAEAGRRGFTHPEDHLPDDAETIRELADAARRTGSERINRVTERILEP